MSDFDGLLTSDFGYKRQGKSAPMSAPSNTAPRSFNFDIGPDLIFSSGGVQKPLNGGNFDDLFGAPSKHKDESVDFDSVFGPGSQPPVYDKPVYDDDIFEGVSGINNFSSSYSGSKYDDVFESVSAPSTGQDRGSSAFDDLLGGFGEANNLPKSNDSSKEEFDDLIPGFGVPSPASERLTPKPTWSSDPVATSRKIIEDPFADLASVSPHVNSSFAVPSDPLENFNNPSKSDEGAKADEPSVSSGVYDDFPFDVLTKPVSTSSSDTSSSMKDRNSMQTDRGNINGEEQVDQISPRGHRSHSNKPSVDNLESHHSFFDMPSASNSFSEPADHRPSAPYETGSSNANIPVQEESVGTLDEVWLSVSEIPLFTRPTSAPPPARPPPPRPTRASKVGSGHSFEVPKSAQEGRSATVEELETFVMGRSTEYNRDVHANGFSSEAVGPNPDAAASEAAASEAAMKEAMDRAETKFRRGKEVRERESTRAARSRESVQQESDESWLETEERAIREKQERLQKQREEEEKERIWREKEREREEKEREQRRLEKERERAREERERARQIVERATREARERAAAEARAKAERAAVAKANAEARERAERAAVQRAQAEARERAAAEARERAERAAAEAREREARERATEARMKAERAEKEAAEAREKEAREKAAEAKRRAERAAVERAAAEARQRAAVEARDRAAAAARANQQKNDNDLESFFSAPRPKTNPTESTFDAQFPSKKGPEVARTSDAAASSVRKASPSANFVDDFSSIFGVAPTTSGDFQEVKGETEERRRARLERHQRAQERAAKALAEKNNRDLQAQREQDERHRIGESLDVEIKRWSAGKEGNLRALLSTLHYVLWPGCGWQPVSLTDLMTGAAVKKQYRKATLCIHPDKVQQKGANLQQKYVAEKVFDLLKEAWNKFNSEELF